MRSRSVAATGLPDGSGRNSQPDMPADLATEEGSVWLDAPSGTASRVDSVFDSIGANLEQLVEDVEERGPFCT